MMTVSEIKLYCKHNHMLLSEYLTKNNIPAYYVIGEYKFPIYDLKCKNCGELLNVITKDDEFYVCTCKKCTESIKYTTVNKINSIIGDINKSKELYDYIGKYRTRKFDLSIEEQHRKLKLAADSLKKHPEKHTTKIEYWLNKGFTEDEARQMLSNRQKTFTLQKCIEKYGEKVGSEIWSNRQNKWQETLNNKSDDEKRRISLLRCMNGVGYSKISQELFNGIYKSIGDKYGKVYFATHKQNDKNEQYGLLNNIKKKQRVIDKKQYEFYLAKQDNFTTYYYRLDFYIPKLHKCIEYEGNYWHSNKEDYDNNRESYIRSKGIDILRIKEDDFINTKTKCINKCIEWIEHND